ncbi:MAG: hypothetical protein E7I22_05175 [Bifidobacterium longum]|nr:hypothetical protein [Bifidobacterium longum]
MHTRNVNVKTATEESSRKMGEGLTAPQIEDLFSYIADNALTQKQPLFFMAPLHSDVIAFQNKSGTATVVIYTRDSWPLAAAIPQSGLLYVLTGIQL